MMTVQLQSRLKDLEFDNFRLERKLQETLSRQWRIESLFNNYVFTKDDVKSNFQTPMIEAILQSQKLQDPQLRKFGSATSLQAKDSQGKAYYVHLVDYLQNNCFRRIQDAID